MNQQQVRVGIIGAGANTIWRHIPGLQAIEGVEIVSICNRSRQSSQRVAQQFDIPKIYETWWQLVSAPDTDAIVVGTWPYLHCPTTLAALAAEKHILVEARMAMNLEEAEKMLAMSKSKPHLVAQVVPAPFSLGVDATIIRLINEGFLGDILAIEVRDNSGEFLDKDAPLTWRQDSDLSGLNMMSLGIWYETIMRWVGEATSVTAAGKTFIKMRRDLATQRMKAVRIPEHIVVLADMTCGAQAAISISKVTGLAPAREAVLYGSRGTLRFDGSRLFAGQRGDSSLSEMPIPEEEQGSWRVEEEFIAAVLGMGKIQLTTFDGGVKYMRFTEAVVRSMLNGERVNLL